MEPTMDTFKSGTWMAILSLTLCLFSFSVITGCDKGSSEAHRGEVKTTPEATQSAAKPESHKTHTETTDLAVGHKHERAGETCFICDAALRDKGRLWCKEHSRYEDRCWLCHPELEDKNRLYCKEHGLYEDECFL